MKREPTIRLYRNIMSHFLESIPQAIAAQGRWRGCFPPPCGGKLWQRLPSMTSSSITIMQYYSGAGFAPSEDESIALLFVAEKFKWHEKLGTTMAMIRRGLFRNSTSPRNSAAAQVSWATGRQVLRRRQQTRLTTTKARERPGSDLTR